MRKITQKELDGLIERHQHWLDKDCDGWQGMRLTLNGCDLSGLNMDGASLDCVSMNDVYLSGTSMRGVSLNGAALNGVSLDGASLMGASLNDVYLGCASLMGASLEGASMDGASLMGVYLGGTSLEGASLKGASGVKFPLACPSEGAFVAWKKVLGFLVKLEIPADARRSSATTAKCRCDKAMVLDIYDADGVGGSVGGRITEIENKSYAGALYKVGEMVYPDSWDEDRWNECSHGIHFFVDKQAAIDY